MKKFPFRKLALILLISVFALCLPAVLSACGVKNSLFDIFVTRACNACQASCIKSCNASNYATEYELTEDGNAYKLTHYSNEFEDVVIPETYNGLPVTTIGEHAFAYSSLVSNYGVHFKSLTLPSTITTIEEGAFDTWSDTSTFNKVYFNGSLEQYFNIYFGDRLLYLTEMLYIDGEEVVDLVIPEGFEEVPDRVFAYYHALESVTLPQSLKAIGSDAFYYCGNLQSINIPENLQSIGNSAFSDCINLSSPLNFSQNLLSVGNSAFYGDRNISEITFHENIFVSIKDYAFYSCGITTLDIPGGVRLGKGAFNSSSLETLKIATETIGESAFSYCVSLTEIAFADSVKIIDSRAFSKCKSIKTLDLSQTKVHTIGDYAFEDCGLHIVYLPQTLENLNSGAFYDNPRLYEVYNLSQIELNVGWHTSGIINNAKVIHTSLSEPLQVECVGGWYFFYGEDETELFACEEYVFTEYPNYHITLPQTEYNYTLASDVFQNVEILTVHIPSCVTAIGDKSFLNCTKLYEVTFSEELISIGDYAFWYCTSLYKIILPEGLETLGEYAFGYCASLETIILPSTLTNINANMFEQCGRMTSITVHPDNPIYYSENNCIIERESGTLIYGCSESEIPEGISAIGDNAFRDSFIVKVIVPEGVTTIGAAAFYNCNSLSEVSLPSTLETIEASAFMNCIALKQITLYENLTHIGNYAFAYSGLTEITISGNVTTVGYNSFWGCNLLTTVTVSDGVKGFDFDLFNYCNNLRYLYLPEDFDLINFIPPKITGVTIHYAGTVAQWRQSVTYDFNDLKLTVICSDGTITYPEY